MMKRALILDLDNTVYPVSSIANELFAQLFATLELHAEDINGTDPSRLDKIKHEMTRRPFQHIADEFALDAELRNKMVDMLKNMTYDQPMLPFGDYVHLKSLRLDKFLVTTGFTKLQQSKIRMLGIERDFKGIHIVDPDVSTQTKKEVFSQIMVKYRYSPGELFVIGDDPASEIKAAKALMIDSVLYDPSNKYPAETATHQIDNFKKIAALLN